MSDDFQDLEPIDLSEANPPSGTWAAGWYADPWTAGQYRYWTGRTWTGETNRWGPATGAAGVQGPAGPATDSPFPSPPVAATAAGATASAANEPWASMSAPAPGGLGRSTEPPGSDAGPGGAGSSKPRGPMVAGIIALVLLLVVSGAVGYALDSRSSSKSAAIVPGPLSPAPTAPATTPTVPSTPSTTPAPADPDRGVLGRLVVQQADVAAARMVVLIPNGNQTSQPTLDLCNGTYASERLRTARLQVADVDANGDTSLSTEAVLYRNAAASAEAFAELRAVSAACPHSPVPSPVGEQTAETEFKAPPDGSWPSTASVQRLSYSLVTIQGGTSSPSIAVYLRRGRALLGLYFPVPTGAQPAVAGQRTIEGIVGVFEARMAALPASVVNGHS